MGTFPWDEGRSEAIESCDEWYEHEHNERKKWDTSYAFTSKLKARFNPAKDVEEGSNRVKKIFHILNNIKLRDGTILVRTPDQIAWHKACVAALLPKIYGKSWERCSAQVLKEWGLTHIEYRLLIFAARRVGKTWTIAMLCTALMLVVPGTKTIHIHHSYTHLYLLCLLYSIEKEGGKV